VKGREGLTRGRTAVLRMATEAEDTKATGIGADYSAEVGQVACVLWHVIELLVASIVQRGETEEAFEVLAQGFGVDKRMVANRASDTFIHTVNGGSGAAGRAGHARKRGRGVQTQTLPCSRLAQARYGRDGRSARNVRGYSRRSDPYPPTRRLVVPNLMRSPPCKVTFPNTSILNRNWTPLPWPILPAGVCGMAGEVTSHESRP
jgi:hypothetical protein